MQFTLNTLYKDRPVEILVGVSSRESAYFMVITPEDDDHPDANEESGLIYSNLDDDELPFPGMAPNLEHFRKRLTEMGMYTPDVKTFIRMVEVNTD